MFYDSMDTDVTDKVPYIEASSINEKVSTWLSDQKAKDKPYFLWVHYMDVHEPYIPARKYIDLVAPSINLSEDEMFSLFKNVLLKRDVSNKDTVELLRKLYLAGVRKIDDAVREFFGVLEEADLLNESFVIMTADHGDEFGEHGGLSHDGKLYSALVDVPLILFDPTLSEGKVCDRVVSTIDVSPTILHLFGIEPVAGFQGHSLLPMEDYPRKGVYGESIEKRGERERGDEKPVYFYRENNLKIIYHEERDSWELYDLGKDPHEQDNIVDHSPAAEEMRNNLISRVGRWGR